jgi:hypothetical protein
VQQRRGTVTSDRDPDDDERVQRFEAAVGDLIEEGFSFSDAEVFLRAAAERAGLEWRDVFPTAQ